MRRGLLEYLRRMRYALVLAGVLGCSTVSPADDTEGVETGGATGASASNVTSELMPPSSSGGEDEGTLGETAPTGGATIDGEMATTGGTGGESTGAPLSEGCGVTQEAGAQDRTLVIEGVDRHYKVVVPPEYDPANPYPVVFAWHGRGGDGAGARLYFKIEEASDGAAIVVYPDGLPQADMEDQTGWDLTEQGVDVAFFDAMLADVSATLCVDAGRVFSAGHSFGGFMSNTLGCFRGGVVRAIAPVAGGGPVGLGVVCTGQVAAWLAHGTGDQIVPFMFGEASRDRWAGANSCDKEMAEPVTPAPCVAYAGCDEGYPVHWCQHDDPVFMGHTWPAWAGPGIWRFFAAL